MNKQIALSVRHYFNTKNYIFLTILLCGIPFSGHDLGVIFVRFIWIGILLSLCNQAFIKSWSENRETRTSLFDALLVPCNQKLYIYVQIAVLTLVHLIVSLIFFVIYRKTHLQHPLTFQADALNMMIQSLGLLLSLFFSHITKAKKDSHLYNACAVAFGAIYLLPNAEFDISPLFSIALFAVLIVIALLDFIDTKKTNETQTHSTHISNNLKGLLVLSRMQIVSEKYTFDYITQLMQYFFISYVIRILIYAFDNSANVFDVLQWQIICFMLCLLSAFSSFSSLNRIYNSKSMLRIVPVKKGELFAAFAFLANAPWLLLLTVAVATSMVVYAQTGIHLFFMSSQPLEIIIHALYLITFPYTIFLLCFLYHTQKDRTMYVIGLFFVLIVGGILVMFFSQVAKNTIIDEAVLLVSCWTIPLLLAKNAYDKMENIHW